MKTALIILGCFLGLNILSSATASAHPRPHGGVTFRVFYDGLAPHGEWISVSSGVYGWRPSRIASGWRPYTVGRWWWTDDGWYWMSDEPWGWAVYHYGRWHYDDYYGWVWIPGYDWAPAWVEWRYGPDYIGWAPLSPYAVFSVSWGIHYRTRWYTPVHWWSFVGCGYMTSPNVHRHIYRHENNTRYIGVTRTGGSVRHSGGRIVTRGPEREFVERRGNVRIEPVGIRDVDDRPVERFSQDGNRGQIEVYRPRIQERSADNAIERPERVREEAGRPLDIDTRKIDTRSREVARDEGRDLKRIEEFRTRNETGRSLERRPDVDRSRDDGMLKGPVDDATRSREGRSRERSEQDSPKRDDGRTYDRPSGRSGEGRERQPEVRPERPEREQQPRNEPRRESSVERSRGGEVRSAAPERRVETPRSDSPRRSDGGGRSESGRRGR